MAVGLSTLAAGVGRGCQARPATTSSLPRNLVPTLSDTATVSAVTSSTDTAGALLLSSHLLVVATHYSFIHYFSDIILDPSFCTSSNPSHVPTSTARTHLAQWEHTIFYAKILFDRPSNKESRTRFDNKQIQVTVQYMFLSSPQRSRRYTAQRTTAHYSVPSRYSIQYHAYRQRALRGCVQNRNTDSLVHACGTVGTRSCTTFSHPCAIWNSVLPSPADLLRANLSYHDTVPVCSNLHAMSAETQQLPLRASIARRNGKERAQTTSRYQVVQI